MKKEEKHVEKEKSETDVNGNTCGPGCECNTEKKMSNKTKAIIIIIILLAAGAVLTRSLILKSDTGTGNTNEAFASVQARSQPQEKDTAASVTGSIADKNTDTRDNTVSSEKTTDEADNAESKVSKPADTKESFWKEPLSSLSSLNTVAVNNDAVIVLVSEREIQEANPEVKVIDAAAKTITSRGVNIAAFSLKKDAPEFSNLAKQLSGSGVLVMVKGRGMSGVPSTEITEEKLIQAYVTASQPRSGCGPSCGPSDCK